MLQSLINFPYPKLKDCKYLALEVMKHIEYLDALTFMFTLNKETRNFLK